MSRRHLLEQQGHPVCTRGFCNLFTGFTKMRLSPEIVLQGDCSHLHILSRDLFPIFTRVSSDPSSNTTSCKMPPSTDLPNKARYPVVGLCIFSSSHWPHHKSHPSIYAGLINHVRTPHPKVSSMKAGSSCFPTLSLQGQHGPIHRRCSGGTTLENLLL